MFFSVLENLSTWISAADFAGSKQWAEWWAKDISAKEWGEDHRTWKPAGRPRTCVQKESHDPWWRVEKGP